MGDWTRSSLCNADSQTSNCIDVNGQPDVVLIRDSHNEAVVIEASRPDWEKFRDGIKNGDFDNV